MFILRPLNHVLVCCNSVMLCVIPVIHIINVHYNTMMCMLYFTGRRLTGPLQRVEITHPLACNFWNDRDHFWMEDTTSPHRRCYLDGRVRVFLTQQWRQPIDVRLAVRVQEGDDFPFGSSGSEQPSPDQPLPLLRPQDANLRHPLHVLLQGHL